MVRDGYVICDKCGKRLGPDDRVCPSCGTAASYSDSSSSSFSFNFRSLNVCTVLSIIVAVLGFIGSIYLANRFGVSLERDYDAWSRSYDVDTVRDVGSTISIFVSGCFVTFVLSAILYTLGSISDKLDALISK